jgi:hypothetical protein
MTAEPFEPAAEPFEIGSIVRAELHILGCTFVLERSLRRRPRAVLHRRRWAMVRA